MQVRECYPIATRVNSNATTPIPGKRLRRLIVGAPGTTWAISVQDLAANVKVIITPTAVGAIDIGWEFGAAGCQLVTTGTAGDLMALSE